MLDEQQQLREKVWALLNEAKKKNPKYSLRAMAKKIDLSPGYLSSFLQGKKAISPQTMEKIVHSLIKSPEERKDLLEHLNFELIERLKVKSTTSNYGNRTLTNEEILLLNEWHYYALRSLVSLDEFKLDLHWISNKLGIGLDAVDQALNRLVDMGILRINNGKVETTTQHLKTPDNTELNDEMLKAMNRVHANAIDHARNSLTKIPRSERDITWVNIPCDEAKLEKARELIRKFQDDMMAFLEDGGNKNQVMRLTIQLCPVLEKSSNE